jgi:hypothetical protein
MLDGPIILGTSPEDGEEGAPRLGPFVADVDRLLLPRTVTRATVRIESGTIRHLVTVRFDPIERRIVAAPFFDAPLEPEVVYRFTIEEVRDLDGQRLGTPFVARFRTGEELGDPPAEPERAWSDVAPILESRCATAECHGGSDPMLGLDLASAEGVRTTAIGVRSRQLSNAGTEPSRGALSFGGLSRIEVVAGVGLPEESYLVYKLLGDAPIEGERMPPESAGLPLEPGEVATIAAWIRSGAPTE